MPAASITQDRAFHMQGMNIMSEKAVAAFGCEIQMLQSIAN